MPFNSLGKNTQIEILIITPSHSDYLGLQNLLLQIETNIFEVSWIDNFESGLVALDNHSPDVCLVSYDLGKYNGLQLLRIALKQGCKSPIILLTEYRDRAIDVAAIKAGAADYLDRNQLDSQLLERSIRYGIERKKVEQKIQEQAALLDVATDAILVRSLENKIIFWNKGAEHLYGWKSEEVLGQDAGKLLFPNPSQFPVDIYDRLAQIGYWQGELTQVNKTGSSLIVQSSWTLVKDRSAIPKSILIVNTDITQKKQLESQVLLNQRLESIGTLASGIAHDLNNLLTPMMMIVQLLQFQSTEQKYLDWVSILEKNVNRGRSLVRKILTFSQGYQGEYIPLPVKELILEIKQIIQQTFPKDINIEVSFAENVGNVCGDATQIHQFLLNICLNARDAMPNGGILKIELEQVEIDEEYVKLKPNFQPGDYVVIAISDTGMGISNDIIDKIFDPFFTTKDREKGTGLGLSTTMGIVKSHGGFIEVNTERRKGSTFKVYLPATTSSEIPISSEKPQEIIGQGELILVVDDEAFVGQVTKSLLEASGYQCLIAQDGVEAIAIFAERKLEIKLVLVDAIMPLMDGLTTIRTLRKIDHKVKVVVVSALAANIELLESDRLNTQGFILKPYTGQELLQTIDRALKIDN
ncbi:hybrid sensor histidine kinase/response regulator [Merismopedia glauca]|uniref:histidine kinase n=1 Tax=Merismopedia glauca CCAP 1448/3 TaxID=1296344 RepID=A0A2T1C9A1_9CYAN|nr:response regulator [Merismopedia glauca]PSB04836.1 hybrid sensor histidine kinase/response regulator [Merismopedia glauca CCAP 1448/3]